MVNESQMCSSNGSGKDTSPMEDTGQITKTDETKKKLCETNANELFEEILNQIGGFGRFHIGLWIIGLWVCVLCACNHLSPIYYNHTPEYNCTKGKTK